MFKLSKKIKNNKGMTYIELIVVLSIFAIMSSIILYNYGEFQAKVDIKNLASDIALKIVEAQKSALSGKWTSGAVDGWKPSYGIYFNTSSADEKKKFTYFADFNNDKIYNDTPLDTISITKGNYIEKIESCAGSPTICALVTNSFLSIIFTRPNSGAVFSSLSGILTGFDYIQITISSPQGKTALIKIYPSGRIQVN
ncbi:type II secretion system protein [Candidatus Nomurabacteria bacterium]|nr:type II secretion system protein [Candidatus Nomurabacteria bacterium]